MSFTKMIITVLFITVCFSALALKHIPHPHHPKHLVLHYHTRAHKLLHASNDYLYKNGLYSLHIQNEAHYILLGEKHKITLPDISESVMVFQKYFTSAELYLLPACQWVTLNTAIEQIQQMKRKLHPIKQIATSIEECNAHMFTTDFFKNKNSALICKYNLRHYTISFWIHKFNTIKSTQPPEEDFFQLILKLENKKA